jgi:hypothetical protein
VVAPALNIFIIQLLRSWFVNCDGVEKKREEVGELTRPPHFALIRPQKIKDVDKIFIDGSIVQIFLPRTDPFREEEHPERRRNKLTSLLKPIDCYNKLL